MVDVFGGSRRFQALRGPRGPRGVPGISGSINDFCKWLPNSVLSQLQQHEESCFLLTNTSDVKLEKKDEVAEWICRNKKHANITAELPGHLIEVPGFGYAVDFQKSRYKTVEMDLFVCTKGYGYFCITFRVDSGEETQ